MAKLKILTGDKNPILRKKSVEVKKSEINGKKLMKLIKDMKGMLKPADLGLAAPQVGAGVRVALARLNPASENGILITMTNPEITHFSEEKLIAEEGCLSLPNVWANVPRAKKITVKFFDSRGREEILHLEGLNARIIQHEVDHLDGILIVDKAVAVKGGGKTIL